MKKPHKIQAFISALILIIAAGCLTRSDSVLIPEAQTQPVRLAESSCRGAILPASGPGGNEERNTGNIYADTPQIAVPRNTVVSAQPRQQTTAKRTGSSGFGEATLKDGKLITRYTFISYTTFIELFPSGLGVTRTRLMSLRKLII